MQKVNFGTAFIVDIVECKPIGIIMIAFRMRALKGERFGKEGERKRNNIFAVCTHRDIVCVCVC